ncbi:hypothetical protein ABIA35_006018 [Catenulispora sp. MAP12-49]
MVRATIRNRADADLNASFRAWSHLTAYGLASQIVCRTLFRRWNLCACGCCRWNGGAR